MKTRIFLCLAAIALAAVFPARAVVVSGAIDDLNDSQTYSVTDGTNSADLNWSVNAPGATAYVYATFSTAVAVATGITNVTQITNAAVFTFVTSPFSAIGPVADAAANGGTAQFVVLRNQNTTHYAVVRMDDVQDNGKLDATWYFQSDGSADFSSFVPGGPPLTLAGAVDATNLTWTTGGTANWFPQTTTTSDTVDAAQTGVIGDDEYTQIETTVTGPGTVIFKWRVSSELFFDELTFYRDNVFQAAISGTAGDWVSVTNQIAAGTHTLLWEYYKDSDSSAGADAGWLDAVQFISPAGPVTDLKLAVAGGNAVVSFTTQNGRTHTVEARTNVASGVWSALTNFTGDGSLRSFPFPIGNLPRRFFRVGTQ